MLNSENEVRKKFMNDKVKVRDAKGGRYVINDRGEIESISIAEDLTVGLVTVATLSLMAGGGLSDYLRTVGLGFVMSATPTMIFCFILILPFVLFLSLMEYKINADLDGVSNLENVQFGYKLNEYKDS